VHQRSVQQHGNLGTTFIENVKTEFNHRGICLRTSTCKQGQGKLTGLPLQLTNQWTSVAAIRLTPQARPKPRQPVLQPATEWDAWRNTYGWGHCVLPREMTSSFGVVSAVTALATGSQCVSTAFRVASGDSWSYDGVRGPFPTDISFSVTREHSRLPARVW